MENEKVLLIITFRNKKIVSELSDPEFFLFINTTNIPGMSNNTKVIYIQVKYVDFDQYIIGNTWNRELGPVYYLNESKLSYDLGEAKKNKELIEIHAGTHVWVKNPA